MSILSVNLKHLYQRRGLWLAYVVFGLLIFAAIAIPLDRPSAGNGQFMGLVMLEFLIGMCMASLPVEILTKPFSFCLPGHRRVPRKFVFSVGVVTSLPGSLIFLAYPHLHWWEWAPMTCCAAFCAGLIMYWAGVGLAFGIRNSGSITGFAFLPIFGVLFFDLHAVAERAIIGHPFAIVLLGLASSALVWIWLGNSNWARRLCAVSRLGFFDLWNIDRVRKSAQKRAAVKWDKLKNHPSPQVERFFLRRMSNCNRLGSGRYIWGGLYTTYGMAISNWKGNLLGVLIWLAMVIFMSYWGPRGTDMLFYMGAAAVVYMPLPLYSSMIIPGGRKERLAAAIILAGTAAVLVTAVLAVMAAVSIGLAPIMPDISFRGEDISFHAMSLRLLGLPSVVIPMILAFRLIIYKKPFSTLISMMLVFGLLFAFGINSSEGLGTLINPTSLTSLSILGWLALVLVLRHICMRRSLVGQGRTY